MSIARRLAGHSQYSNRISKSSCDICAGEREREGQDQAKGKQAPLLLRRSWTLTRLLVELSQSKLQVILKIGFDMVELRCVEVGAEVVSTAMKSLLALLWMPKQCSCCMSLGRSGAPPPVVLGEAVASARCKEVRAGQYDREHQHVNI